MTTVEFTDDPAKAPVDSKVAVNCKDSEFGMVRVDDWLTDGTAVALFFDYTDHLYFIHECGGDMRLRKRRDWLELSCNFCDCGYIPYRRVGKCDDGKGVEAKPPKNRPPIRLRRDMTAFLSLMRLAGYSRRVHGATVIVHDDALFRYGPHLDVSIRLDDRQNISFIHSACGRHLSVTVKHCQDTYNKDFLYLRCRCRYWDKSMWIRKVVTDKRDTREWLLQRSKPVPEPTDWRTALKHQS